VNSLLFDFALIDEGAINLNLNRNQFNVLCMCILFLNQWISEPYEKVFIKKAIAVFVLKE